MAKVAFLGLGVMGYPMAGHLKSKGGHDVTVYNRTTAKADKWVAQHGGKRALTPRAAHFAALFTRSSSAGDETCYLLEIGARPRQGRFGCRRRPDGPRK